MKVITLHPLENRQCLHQICIKSNPIHAKTIHKINNKCDGAKGRVIRMETLNSPASVGSVGVKL